MLLCFWAGLPSRSPAVDRWFGPPSPSTSFRAKAGGAEGSRTPDPLNAIQVLYQLSYDPNAIRRCERGKIRKPAPPVKKFSLNLSHSPRILRPSAVIMD